jgi:hypothetical protein
MKVYNVHIVDADGVGYCVSNSKLEHAQACYLKALSDMQTGKCLSVVKNF